MVAMTAAFIALNHNDSDIGRFRRSSEDSEDRKALLTRAVFDFLWIIVPTSVMFAVAISTYCTCSRTFLKRTHWFHFFNLLRICYYGVVMLLLLVWKLLKGDGHFMPPSIRKDINIMLEYLYILYIGIIFIGAAVFVHPGSRKCCLVMGFASGGVMLFSGLLITDSNDAPPSSALVKNKLDPTLLFFVIGTILAAAVELWFMFQALSLSRIKTLTEAKRYVLVVIILLLYTGYCIYSIYGGCVKGLFFVPATMRSFCFSAWFKVFWGLKL